MLVIACNYLDDGSRLYLTLIISSWSLLSNLNHLLFIVFMNVMLYITQPVWFHVYTLVTDFHFYVTDVLLKFCSKLELETCHLVLPLNKDVLTGVSLGSSSDLGETKVAFLLRAPDRRNLPLRYFFCLGDECNQIAILWPWLVLNVCMTNFMK